METKKCPSCGTNCLLANFIKMRQQKTDFSLIVRHVLKLKETKLCLVAITHFGTSARAN
nr:MAG TPA: zinc ribbon domain protein [Caudoviricetes sp.]